MWFKNLYLFQFEKPFGLNAEALHEALSFKQFSPCEPTQRESMGWVPALGQRSSALTHGVNGFTLLSMARQERLLPASVVREELDVMVQAIQDNDARKVGAKEKKELREAIEFDLLPRAFTRTKTMDAWIDAKGGWLVVNTTSAAQAELFATLLRKTLGSLPVVPVACQQLGVLMSEWLSKSEAPFDFELGEECELTGSGDDGGVASFKKHELGTDEVKANLSAGKQVSKLAMIWNKKVSFVLDDSFGIKKLKFLDVCQEKLQQEDPQTHEERMDIEFTLMTGEVALLLKGLSDAVGVATSEECERVDANDGAGDVMDEVKAVGSDNDDPSAIYAEAKGNLNNDASVHSGAQYDRVVRNVIDSQQVSISAIQLRFKLGYNIAASYVESMEAQGVVSKVGSNGTRKVLVDQVAN